MYYIIGAAILILLLRSFDLLPKLENKFWRSVDSLILVIAALALLSRFPPFVAGIFLTLATIYAYRKGFFSKSE